MIVTTLPEGTWIRVRNSRMEGGFEFGRLVMHDGEMCWEIGLMPKPGTVVHKVVWKRNDVIESRGTFTYQGT